MAAEPIADSRIADSEVSALVHPRVAAERQS